MTNPLDQLDHMPLRPLSDEERDAVWMKIHKRIPTTPTQSAFFIHSKKLATAMVVLIFFFSSAEFIDTARPGMRLFPVDLALERIETFVDPTSRVDHARERVAEFETIFGSTPSSDEISTATFLSRKKESAATEDGLQAPVMALMVADNAATLSLPSYPPNVQKAIDATRNELAALAEDALIHHDLKTFEKIEAISEAFEQRLQNR